MPPIRLPSKRRSKLRKRASLSGSSLLSAVRARGVYLDIHGGGFYMDSAARGDKRNRELADALHLAVVSVDYRLAPEHPWPAAPDDCEAAALWLVEEADARFGTSRLAIGGSSAGATLALATLLRLRDRGAVGRFTGAALQFGTYDLSARTPAGRRIADEYFIQAYAGHVGRPHCSRHLSHLRRP